MGFSLLISVKFKGLVFVVVKVKARMNVSQFTASLEFKVDLLTRLYCSLMINILVIKFHLVSDFEYYLLPENQINLLVNEMAFNRKHIILNGG